MKFGKKRGIVSFILAGCLLLNAQFEVFAAAPPSETQVNETISYETKVSPLASTWELLPEMASVAVDTQEWCGKALANTEQEMDVYAQADGTVIGKVYSNTIITVDEKGEQWCKVTSGSVVGYVKTESLLFGSAAVERAETACAAGTRNGQTLEEIEAEKKSAQVKLLAALIYCEAGNQPYKGKVAVGSVVMNRISSSRYPNTMEKVIYQRGQFTPAMTGKLARVLSSGRVPSSCYDAALDAMNGAKPVGNALYFNTGYGKIKLGDHYFS